jgi:hypothetical protein
MINLLRIYHKSIQFVINQPEEKISFILFRNVNVYVNGSDAIIDGDATFLLFFHNYDYVHGYANIIPCFLDFFNIIMY